MKKITINSETRQLSQASTTVGYLQENKVEKLEFEIPEEYKNYGRKACFKAQDKTFAKIFDDITGNTLTLTRDMTQYDELEMSIAFFKTENEDEIVARTSILKIYIENAIICDNDIQPDDPKVVILDELIQKVTKLNDQVTKDEEIRQNQENTRQQNESVREENEQGRVFDELGRKKAEEERKTNELERISNENTRDEYINNLKAQVDSGEFDGADFNYKWDGTKLGVKNSKETTYQFVELKGDKGDKGDTGNGIQNIEKVSTVENVDTYAIHYTDGTQTTFDVTNGEVTKEQLDEVDNRAKKTRNELERVKNDILETGTASDSFINVQDSAWAELQELSVDGVCEQQTTTGKNVLPNNATSQTINGVNYTVNSDGSVYAKGTATARSEFFIYNKPFTLNANTEYKIQSNILTILSTTTDYISGNKGQTFTSESEISVLKAYIRVENGASIDKTIYPMITLVDANDTYEPYTGGQPSPSPDYPQEIETITGNFSLTSCNKNLFNKNKPNILNAYISGVDGKIGSDNVTSIFVKCKQNTNYTISKIVSSRFIVGTTSVKPQNKVICNFFKRNDNVTNITISTNSNDKYLIVYVLNSKDELILNKIFDSLQIEESLTVTSFEEHLQSQITVNLPEGEFIGKFDENYKDELVAVYNQEEGKYHLMLNKMIGKKVVDGNTGSVAKIGDNYFGIDNAIKNFLQFSDFTIDNNKNNKYVTLAQTSLNIQFFSISKDYNYAMNFTCGMSHNNIRIKDIRLNTVDELKQSLNEKPMEVYYTLNLNSRYSLDLGPIDIPLSYNEVTNIFTDSDLLPKINAKYYRNFTKTVQNLQVNEKALKQELIDINNRLTALETTKASESEVNNDISVE